MCLLRIAKYLQLAFLIIFVPSETQGLLIKQGLETYQIYESTAMT